MRSSSPVVDYQQNIYFGVLDGMLYSVDGHGTLRFAFRAGGRIQAGPAMRDDTSPVLGEFYEPPPTATLYFGADDGQLYALSTTGALRWSLRPGSPPNTSPLYVSPAAIKTPGSRFNRIYIGAGNGKVYAVFETNQTAATTAWGGPDWRGALTTAPTLAPNGDILYVGGDDGKLYCLDANTGANLHNTPVELGLGRLTTPVVDAGNVFVGTQKRGLYGFDRDCQPRPYWQPGLTGPLGPRPRSDPTARCSCSLAGASMVSRFSARWPGANRSAAPLAPSHRLWTGPGQSMSLLATANSMPLPTPPAAPWVLCPLGYRGSAARRPSARHAGAGWLGAHHPGRGRQSPRSALR